ncbi:hypothetical protein NDU88_004355 [Pleurodeles waltl]|uniref:Uncharacterized protein n=1 Tax=Pleurodeles waltl TaxID=8319 RepID=A0AAV7LQP8_PLEWA|nr:hypothetical protein NDU88_004355 [Pleurodeles waltl]
MLVFCPVPQLCTRFTTCIRSDCVARTGLCGCLRPARYRGTGVAQSLARLCALARGEAWVLHLRRDSVRAAEEELVCVACTEPITCRCTGPGRRLPCTALLVYKASLVKAPPSSSGLVSLAPATASATRNRERQGAPVLLRSRRCHRLCHRLSPQYRRQGPISSSFPCSCGPLAAVQPCDSGARPRDGPSHSPPPCLRGRLGRSPNDHSLLLRAPSPGLGYRGLVRVLTCPACPLDVSPHRRWGRSAAQGGTPVGHRCGQRSGQTAAATRCSEQCRPSTRSRRFLRGSWA